MRGKVTGKLRGEVKDEKQNNSFINRNANVSNAAFRVSDE